MQTTPQEQQTILIVADDVTGAADSAARCRHAGLSALIDLSLGQPVATAALRTERFAPGRAVALSTDSRFLPAQQAAERVATTIAPLAAVLSTSATQWYKKIDSTLRGNLGSEIEALLPFVTPPAVAPCALICPAFPAQQRTLVDGYLGYEGLPPRTVHLPTLLKEQSSLPVAAIPLATIRAGSDPLRRALHEAYRASAVLLVADAETEEDLRALLAATAATLPHALLCGSAGLVGVLAQATAAASTTGTTSTNNPPQPVKALSHPVLAIVGSGSVMAHRQLAYLRTHTHVPVVEVDPTVQAKEPVLSADWVQQIMQQGGDIVLHLPAPAPGIPLEGATPRQYATALATVTRALIQAMQPPTLMLVGGDTAVQTLAALGMQQLHVQTELLPGMPLTTAEDRQGHLYHVILKAGNHGEEATLAALLGLVANEESQ